MPILLAKYYLYNKTCFQGKSLKAGLFLFTVFNIKILVYFGAVNSPLQKFFLKIQGLQRAEMDFST